MTARIHLPLMLKFKIERQQNMSLCKKEEQIRDFLNKCIDGVEYKISEINEFLLESELGKQKNLELEKVYIKNIVCDERYNERNYFTFRKFDLNHDYFKDVFVEDIKRERNFYEVIILMFRINISVSKYDKLRASDNYIYEIEQINDYTGVSLFKDLIKPSVNKYFLALKSYMSNFYVANRQFNTPEVNALRENILESFNKINTYNGIISVDYQNILEP